MFPLRFVTIYDSTSITTRPPAAHTTTTMVNAEDKPRDTLVLVMVVIGICRRIIILHIGWERRAVPKKISQKFLLRQPKHSKHLLCNTWTWKCVPKLPNDMVRISMRKLPIAKCARAGESVSRREVQTSLSFNSLPYHFFFQHLLI